MWGSNNRMARHEPVLLVQVLDGLQVKPGGRYVDATVGSGGHAQAILDQSDPGGFLLGIDRDREALARAQQRLRQRRSARNTFCRLVHANFADLDRVASENGLSQVDGILFDLGVSTEQLEDPERGFSFQRAGPLDMRMDRHESRTAADALRELSEEELEKVIRDYGEEQQARAIARAIVRERARRPILTTTDLAGVVRKVIRRHGARRHPATRTFQALRIWVNRELEHLETGLEAALRILAPGGRLAIMTFHSLEDRVVKHFARRHLGFWESLPAGGRMQRLVPPPLRLVVPKPVRPGDDELRRNPRARSAKLRILERLAVPFIGPRDNQKTGENVL